MNEEETKQESEILNFDKPDFVFIPKNHQWHQEGYYLICRGCPIDHGVYIGSEKMIVGAKEDGTPILKSRKELGM
jgi:hypothetical protein